MSELFFSESVAYNEQLKNIDFINIFFVFIIIYYLLYVSKKRVYS